MAGKTVLGVSLQGCTEIWLLLAVGSLFEISSLVCLHQSPGMLRRKHVLCTQKKKGCIPSIL